MRDIEKNKNICLLLATINIPVYMMGGGVISLTTSILMFFAFIVLEIVGTNV
jgi:hypothetical protein